MDQRNGAPAVASPGRGFRYVFPYMGTAAVPYLGRNPGRKVRVLRRLCFGAVSGAASPEQDSEWGPVSSPVESPTASLANGTKRIRVTDFR